MSQDYCQTCRNDVLACSCDVPNLIPMVKKRPKTGTKDSKAPDVKEIIKGKIGSLFVESIIYDNAPCFLVNDNGKVRVSERETVDGVIYAPIGIQERGYPHYTFDKMYLKLLINNPPTKEHLLDEINGFVDRYLVADQSAKSLVLGDILLTYSMEWIDTVHFPYVVGETESGKSTILHLFRRLGYRPQYGEDIPPADIYNFLEDGEEATGIILEDEAQEMAGTNRDKIRMYKNSYSRGATKARIVGADSNNKRQKFYKTFCFKAFAGERIPEDKGFQERCPIIFMSEGNPKENVKRPTAEALEKITLLRCKMLFWKVLNYHQGLGDINTGLIRRDQELYEDFLRVMSDTKYYDDCKLAVEYFVNQRHEKIYNSLEARIFKILKPTLNDNSIELAVFWDFLTNIKLQTELKGLHDKESFIVYDFGKKISRQWLSKLLIEKFKGTRFVKWEYRDGNLVQRTKVTKYLFDPEVFAKLSVKYNFDGETSPKLVQVGELGELADQADQADGLLEQTTTDNDKNCKESS